MNGLYLLIHLKTILTLPQKTLNNLVGLSYSRLDRNIIRSSSHNPPEIAVDRP